MVSTSAGSQLDSYLAQFNDIPVSTKTAATVEKRQDDLDLFRYRLKTRTFSFMTILSTCISMTATEVFLGIFRDSALMMDLTSESLMELEVALSAFDEDFSTNMPRVYSQVSFDILRRCILCLILLSSGVSCVASTDQTLLANVIYRAQITTFGASAFLIIFPILFGTLFSQSISTVLARARRAERSTHSVIGWIKKMQLSSLGRQLTHPMPPIAKIEEAAREQNNDVIFSCPEIRRSLHFALSTLDADILTALFFFDSTTSMIDNEAFIHSNKSILSSGELLIISTAVFKQRLSTCYRYVLSHVSTSYMPNTRQEEEKYQEREPILRLFHLLKLPLLLCSVAIALNQLQSKLHIICKEVKNNIVIDDVKQNSNTSDSITSTVNENSHIATVIQTKYIAIRQNLLKYRLEIEGTLNKIWLCEQELSTINSMRILIPNSLFSPCINLSQSGFIVSSHSSLPLPRPLSDSLPIPVSVNSQYLDDDNSHHKQAVLSLNTALAYLEKLEVEKCVREREREKGDGSDLIHCVGVDLKTLVALLSGDRNSATTLNKASTGSNLLECHEQKKRLEIKKLDDNDFMTINDKTDKMKKIYENNDSRKSDYFKDQININGCIDDNSNNSNYNDYDDNEDEYRNRRKNKRIVDVYSTTVPLESSNLSPIYSRKYSKYNSSSNNNSTELQTSKMLLGELQDHFKMLDLNDKIVERIKNNDDNDSDNNDNSYDSSDNNNNNNNNNNDNNNNAHNNDNNNNNNNNNNDNNICQNYNCNNKEHENDEEILTHFQQSNKIINSKNEISQFDNLLLDNLIENNSINNPNFQFELLGALSNVKNVKYDINMPCLYEERYGSDCDNESESGSDIHDCEKTWK